MSTVVAKNLAVQNSAGTASTNISFDGTKLVSTALDNSITATANLHDLGVGQTWQAAELTNTGATFTDGSSKFRALGVTYTNSTGKPIMVCCSTNNAANTARYVQINGNRIAYINAYGAANSAMVIVPAGSTYLFEANGTGLLQWTELR